MVSDEPEEELADYIGGFAGSVEVEDGKFGKAVKHQHSGSGPNLPRQSSAHCHQAIPTPDGKGYCVVDLGLDQIVEYPSGRVFRTSPVRAGPRHLLFHPNGRLAFLVYELGNFVSSLSWSPAGGFKILDTHSTVITNSTRSTRSTRLNNPVNPVNPVKENPATLREEALSHYRELLESMHPPNVGGVQCNFVSATIIPKSN